MSKSRPSKGQRVFMPDVYAIATARKTIFRGDASAFRFARTVNCWELWYYEGGRISHKVASWPKYRVTWVFEGEE